MTHPTRAFSGSIINRFTGSKILARVGQISVAFPKAVFLIFKSSLRREDIFLRKTTFRSGAKPSFSHFLLFAPARSLVFLIGILDKGCNFGISSVIHPPFKTHKARKCYNWTPRSALCARKGGTSQWALSAHLRKSFHE